MSIISSNHRLVKVSYEVDQYSAGPGIVIEDSTISVDPNLSAAIDNKLDTSAVGLRLWLDGKNIVTGIGGSALLAEYSRSAESAQCSESTLRDEDGYYLISAYTKNSALNDVSSTLSGAIDYLSANAGKTYSGIAPIIVNNTTNEISADSQDISFGTGLDFTNGVLSITAHSGDPEVESVVKTNSADWGTITALSSTSSVLNNQITAVRNDLNTVSTNTGYLYNDIQTTSGILSGAIDYVSANLPEGFTGASVNTPLTGDGTTATPLGLASSFQLIDPSIYTTATYGGSVSIEGIMPRLQLKTNNSSYNTLGEGGMTVTHPASSVGGGYTTCHYGEKMSLSYNDGDYYLHTMDTTKSGLGVTYKGAPNVKAYYNYSGLSLTNDNGATNEYVNVASIRNWNSVYDTVEANSGSWTGGGSIDTIPFVVQEPLVTGFSGESAYLGIESTALNLSSYVPVSAIGVNFENYVSSISGMNISAYRAAYATNASYASRAYHDSNSNVITSYYQPKLTITGDAGTITAINGSAVGASIPEGWELVAGQGIEIVDDAENNQTTISVTAAGGNPEVESYVQTNSASIDEVVSTYETNSGTYLTAHQDISNKLDTTAFSDVSGSFLTAVNIPESANWNDSTTAYQTNSASYMTEPNLEYNAVNEISGYNGSAIAQYGAEKQWLVHDGTLVHLSNSAQYALGVAIDNVARLLGVDETVLWEGSANTGTLNFTDPLTSFKEFKFYVDVPERGINKVLTFYDAVNTVNPGFIQLTTTTMTTGSVVNDWWQGVYNINATIDTATYKSMSIYANGQYYKQCSKTECGTNASKLVVKKVIGIGRKA